MAKKVVLEVEEFTKVLSFVSDQKLSAPGAVEAFKILNEATLMDITVLPNLPEKAPSVEQPPAERSLTEEEFESILVGE